MGYIEMIVYYGYTWYNIDMAQYDSINMDQILDAWGTLTEDYYYNDLLTAEEYTSQLQERTETYFQE